jgi:hypothetical protein
VSRRQELEADEFSARLAGRDAAASALGKLMPLDAAWDHFVDSYASLGQDVGRRPDALFQGFESMLHDPETRDQLAKIRDEHPEPPSSVYDSHPPTSQRVTRIEAMADDGVVDDGSPGTSLLDAPSAAFTMLEKDIFAESGLEPADWDNLVTDVMTSRVSHAAEILRAQTQRVGAPPTLRTVVEGLGRPGSTGLLEGPTVDEERELVARLLADAAANSLVRDGVATFVLTWNGGLANLQASDGQTIDPWAPAFEAIADASTDAFESWASTHGVDLDRELPTAQSLAEDLNPA